MPLLDWYPPDYPHAPEDVTAIPGPDYIDLTWTPTHFDGGSTVTSVHLYTNWDENATPIRSFERNVTWCRINDLNPGERYVFYMRSENANGIGWWSSSDWAVVGLGAPSAPSQYSVNVGQGGANVTWSIPENEGGKAALGYCIYRGTNASNMSLVAIIYESTRSHTDRGLPLGVRFHYQVIAFNALGEGVRTVIASVRSNYAPRGLSISQNDFGDCDPHWVALTWSHPENNHSHVLEYRVTSSTPGVLPASGLSQDRANTSCVLLDPGGWGANVYKVAAVYDEGDVVFSN